MELQKLSSYVNRRATTSVNRIIFGFCFFAGIIILALVFSHTIKDNSKQVRLYSSQVDNSMSQKVAFINTIAAGASAGLEKNEYNDYVNNMVEQYDDVSAVYVCVKEDDAVYSDGIMTYMSGGWVPENDFVVSERGWYQGASKDNEVYVSEPYVDAQSGNICITLSRAIYSGGQLIGVAGLDMYMDDLVKMIENSYSGGDYVFLVSTDGTILTHPSEELALSAQNVVKVSDEGAKRYQKVCQKSLSSRLIMDYSGGPKIAISNPASTTGWNVIAVISIGWIIGIMVSIVIASVVLGVVIEKTAKRRLLNGINPLFAPLEDLATNVSKISEGELEYSFSVDEQSKEVNALSVALNDTISSLQACISEIIHTVTAISEKNLDFDVDGDFVGGYAKIKEALIEIVGVLNQNFNSINEKAGTVLEFSENLAETSESVAQAATSQSCSVMSASGEMRKLTEDMESIIQLATSIKSNADNTNSGLNASNEEIRELVHAMDDISACYDEIAGFVTEINAIANQTNLLALNASIEAARAGDAGKGFSVVADEISALSNNSSMASAKISEAIAHSLKSVEYGRGVVTKTEKTILDSSVYSEQNTKMVSDIVSFVETQKQSADEISENLKSISDMVESNAASAQENSAISLQLGECARELMDTIAQFKLRQG